MGRACSRRSLEGRILQSLAVQPDDRVLEVGTGSGYFAACLGGLARSVRSLEIFADLADAARDNLARTRRAQRDRRGHGRDDVRAPMRGYDVIALTGSLPVYDPRFERALAAGGRLFVVTGERPRHGRAADHPHGTGAVAAREPVRDRRSTPLIHAQQPPKFVF